MRSKFQGTSSPVCDMPAMVATASRSAYFTSTEKFASRVVSCASVAVTAMPRTAPKYRCLQRAPPSVKPALAVRRRAPHVFIATEHKRMERTGQVSELQSWTRPSYRTGVLAPTWRCWVAQRQDVVR
jgi:hypothetical protein